MSTKKYSILLCLVPEKSEEKIYKYAKLRVFLYLPDQNTPDRARKTHIELFRVVLPHHLAFIPKLIKEEKPPKAIIPDEPREAQKGEHCDAAERQLHNGIVGALMLGIAAGTGQQEMRHHRHGDGEEDEDGPGETPRGDRGLVDAHPSEPRPEALKLVLRV